MAVPFDELIDNDIDISVGSLPGIDALRLRRVVLENRTCACEGRFRFRPQRVHARHVRRGAR